MDMLQERTLWEYNKRLSETTGMLPKMRRGYGPTRREDQTLWAH